MSPVGSAVELGSRTLAAWHRSTSYSPAHLAPAISDTSPDPQNLPFLHPRVPAVMAEHGWAAQQARARPTSQPLGSQCPTEPGVPHSQGSRTAGVPAQPGYPHCRRLCPAQARAPHCRRPAGPARVLSGPAPASPQKTPLSGRLRDRSAPL